MSYIDNIENCNIFEKDHRSVDAYTHRKGKRCAKLSDKEAYLTKTLCDPANALSKRYKKKLLAEKSDGFSPNVPYSMNKQKRWDTLTSKSLLSNQEKDLPETVVVHRTDVPLSDGCHADTVRNVQIIENDAMATVSSGGRRKPLKYFNDQIRELRQIDKKEVEPARIHFNITTDPSSEKLPSKKAKRTNRRRGLENFDDDDLNISDPNFKAVDEEAMESYEKSRSFTLGDYVLPEEKARQASEPSPAAHPHCSNSQTTAGTSVEDVEKLSIVPVDLLDISEATKAPHIFAVYETKIKGNVESFSLEETILKSVPARFVVTWFGPNRVSIRSPSYFKPIYVLFFEYEENARLLRVRVNSSAAYAEMARKSQLRNLIQNRDWKYGSLFEDLHEFITKTRKEEEEKPADNSRLAMFPEVFDRDVNSETLAPLATKFEEQEQIALLSQLYMEDDFDISSFEFVVDNLDNAGKCCSVCHISNKKDLFASVDGMICRDCVESSILRQLRFNNSFLEIPIIAPPGCSPIDLLYAALPAPVMSFLVKRLYAFCNPNNTRFVKCPRCHADLTTASDGETSSCKCSNCACAFCYLCDCEPHWPMSCEEYKRWTDRWDTHYFLEQNHIVGDGQVRLCLFCEEVFQVPHGSNITRCPSWRCRWEYDDEGNYRHWHGYKRPLGVRALKHAGALGQKLTFCDECHEHVSPDTIKVEGLVNRETAKICAKARRQRFEKNEKEKFEKYVANFFSSKKEQRKMNETRNLVLSLVENCAAWLYLVKPAESHELKASISKLFSQLTDIQCQFVDSQRRIPEEKELFTKRMAKLERSAEDLIAVFRQYKNEIDLL